ncbi:DUF5658 family protein [Cytobacillus firmus]|uniref:Na(+)/drug antiporter n=1 Tax=Cytobacillus firmus TaxID=1399 RepID=A0A800N8Y8_CYTFI|nr:DUF5658 family protein [Cytobacillus firmus]KAF0822218.1 Na(+)/drug antiporter [Cytobacillus firmus]
MKWIFAYLAFLNFLDGVITYFGIQYGHIQEGNPLMEFVYNANPVFFLVLKIALSGFLFTLISVQSVSFRRPIPELSFVASVLYTAVMVLHLNWII